MPYNTFTAATLALLALAACGTDPEGCTLSLVPAVTVRALAAGTGENVTDGAQGTGVRGHLCG